jgi:catechol 2,3-dioxygenase-like lactoylglutathione lyase family enzyme
MRSEIWCGERAVHHRRSGEHANRGRPQGCRAYRQGDPVAASRARAHTSFIEEVVMNVQFIASIAVIAADPAESRKLYVGSLGLPLEASEGSDYFHSERIGGSKHFAVWPLSQAAQACFGSEEWPSDRPVPQASIEFEVEDADAVQAGAEELRCDGFALLHDARTEPWGQTVARLQSVEGAIVGISFAPTLHA